MSDGERVTQTQTQTQTMTTFEDTVSDVRETVLDKVIEQDLSVGSIDPVVHNVAWNALSGCETVLLVDIIGAYDWDEEEIKNVFVERLETEYRRYDGSRYPMKKVLKSVAEHAVSRRVLNDIESVYNSE